LIDDAQKKEWINGLINHIKDCKETQDAIRFEIMDVTRGGFFVKAERVYARISYAQMPWAYRHIQFWQVITPSLIGKSFIGHVHKVRETFPFALITIRSDKSQFNNVVFPFENNKTYSAIVIVNEDNVMKIDFGYAFGWKYGSYVIDISECETEKNEFSKYTQGSEFNAIYIGKTKQGNHLFRYGENHYFSREGNHEYNNNEALKKDEEKTAKKRVSVGDKLWLEAKKDKYGLFFLIDNVFTGRINPRFANNTHINYVKLIKKELKYISAGQILLCRVMAIRPDNKIELKWEYKEDPVAKDLRIKIDKKLKEAENVKILEIGVPDEKQHQMIKIAPPELKTPTVVGKIDLDAINSKLKPKKKTHAELLKEKEERFNKEKVIRDTFREKRRAKRKEIEGKERKERQKTKTKKKTIEEQRSNSQKIKQKTSIINVVRRWINKFIKR
jgi:hypothetical protein